MNQLEAPHLVTAAESAKTRLEDCSSPPPAPVLVKVADGPEVDHEDDEQSRQEQDSERAGRDGDYSGNQRGLDGSSDDACEPMVNYDGFESVGKPFGFGRFALAEDGDDDVVNVRSPIICKPSGSSTACSRTLSPTCVSALARDEVVRRGEETNKPSWTIQEFQEYLAMLELLQEVCSNAEGEEMCLSADSLGQMERLLTSLLPQGV
ncbi:unnamed protein product [Phytophthora lilii]|uniref:Unnamed protein product n=1 Tax=Phytophthora lilii TaxID=2077276 RepID=A0A9W6TNR0_9STRA|nr:unnamed protein product [Phytophthora lilii]